MMQIHESSTEHGALKDDSLHNELFHLHLLLKLFRPEFQY